MSKSRGRFLHSKTRYLSQRRDRVGRWTATGGSVKAAYTGKSTKKYAGYQKRLAADKKASRRRTARNIGVGALAVGAVAAGGYVAYRKGSVSPITSLGNYPLGKPGSQGRTLPKRTVKVPSVSGIKAAKSTVSKANPTQSPRPVRRVSPTAQAFIGPKLPAKTRQKNYGATTQELEGLARLQNRKVASVPSSQAVKGIQVSKNVKTPKTVKVDAFQQELKQMTRAERLAYRNA